MQWIKIYYISEGLYSPPQKSVQIGFWESGLISDEYNPFYYIIHDISSLLKDSLVIFIIQKCHIDSKDLSIEISLERSIIIEGSETKPCKYTPRCLRYISFTYL